METTQTEPLQKKRYVIVSKAAIAIALTTVTLAICALSVQLWQASKSQELICVVSPETTDFSPYEIKQRLLLTSDSAVNAFCDGAESEASAGQRTVETHYCYAFRDRAGIFYYNGNEDDAGFNLVAYIGESEKLTLPTKIGDQKINKMCSLDVYFVENENSSVKSLYIPSDILTVDAGMISSFTALQEITVSDDHPNYTSIDGILYDKTCKTLIACPREYPSPMIRIPDTVETVARKAFYKCKQLLMLDCPDGMLYFEDEAFKESGLVEIACGKSLAQIGDSAFESCERLEAIHFPQTLRRIGRKAFFHCRFLGDQTLPAQIQIIGDQAFGSTGDMTLHMQMPEREMEHYPWGLDEIAVTWEDETGRFVLRHDIPQTETDAAAAAKIHSLSIPATIRLVPAGTLATYTALKSIEVSSENPWLCSIDGILYSKDATELLCCPQDYDASQLKVPDGVKIVSPCAFQQCTALRSIALPDSVAVIKKNAFEGCESLETICLGKGLKQINESAFRGCAILSKITFPQGLEAIGACVFEGCFRLKEVSIPNSVYDISDLAFLNSKIEKVEIPIPPEGEERYQNLLIPCGEIVWVKE